MAYKFFDKKYLVMPDDESVVGKKVFYNDNLPALIEEVEQGDFSHTNMLSSIIVDDDEGCCFGVSNIRWYMAYHDPYYEAKVAYSQGKTIEYRRKGNDEWNVSTGGVVDEEHYEYRVKPDTWYVHPFVDKDGNCIGQPFYKDTSNKTFIAFEGTEAECDAWIAEHTPKTRRFTNRELAKWCADNKGQTTRNCISIATDWCYVTGEDDFSVPDETRIREWGSDKWHEPLMEVTE